MSNVNPVAVQSTAHLVADYVAKNPALTTRAELNRHFKTTSNIPANDRLSLAILNLLEYGYIYKAFDPEASTVSYWPTPKLASLKGLVLGCYEAKPEPATRSSGYQDFMICQSDELDLNQGTDSTSPSAEVLVPSMGSQKSSTVDIAWCPVKEFLATTYSNNARAEYRARAVLMYLAMRQQWGKFEVVEELNKLIRPYLVTRAIDTLIDKGIVKEDVLHKAEGDFPFLMVVDQGFVATSPQVDPPENPRQSTVSAPPPIATRSDNPQFAKEMESSDVLKAARMLESLAASDRDLVITLITRLHGAHK